MSSMIRGFFAGTKFTDKRPLSRYNELCSELMRLPCSAWNKLYQSRERDADDDFGGSPTPPPPLTHTHTQRLLFHLLTSREQSITANSAPITSAKSVEKIRWTMMDGGFPLPDDKSRSQLGVNIYF